ncbi:ENGASE2 [Scenedesmus sp. PABB004]|nr:ENGASE2 [Scenedesmus sp. PABB004]
MASSEQRAALVPVAAAAAVAGGLAAACLLAGSSPLGLARAGAARWRRGGGAPSAAAVVEEAASGEPWPGSARPGPPRCRPLSSVLELRTWAPPPVGADPCGAGRCAPLLRGAAAPAPPAGGARPLLLVCHDMMGGYLDAEARLAGCGDSSRHYRLWHWDAVDAFVYFSHHLVSVPPAGWTHAAHVHGVKVIGTIITEFGQGRRRCGALFESAAAARGVADTLVSLAAHHGFEGWLVNIENALTQDQVAVVMHFVGYLRARMAAAVPGGMVIWYDAVTAAGELRWQNGLVAANAPFFDLADALFVNYNWTPATLPATAAAAGGRAADVLLGIDVHGRGSYGGGGHGVGAALTAAARAGLSAALFAPGWVFENLERSRFEELQERWWNAVQEAWGASHPVLLALPFGTRFGAGAGCGWFASGALAASGRAAGAAAAAAAGVEACGELGAGEAQQPAAQEQEAEGQRGKEEQQAEQAPGWFNLLLTEPLPCSRDPISQQVVRGPLVGRLTSATAFQGGSCLALCWTPEQQQAPAGQQQAPAVAPCCSLPGGGSVVLLQLFGASVALPTERDATLALTWVCATPPAADGGGGAGAPVIWLMTEPGDGGGAEAAPGGCAGRRCIHVPGRGAAAGQPPPAPQELQLADGRGSGVAVQLVPAAALAGEAQPLGPVECACAAGGAGEPLPAVDALWPPSALADALAGWTWRRAAATLSLPAGRRLAGLGVALAPPSGPGSAGGGAAGTPRLAALLGEVSLSLAAAGGGGGGGGGCGAGEQLPVLPRVAALRGHGGAASVSSSGSPCGTPKLAAAVLGALAGDFTGPREESMRCLASSGAGRMCSGGSRPAAPAPAPRCAPLGGTAAPRAQRASVVARGILDAYRRDKGLPSPGGAATAQQRQQQQRQPRPAVDDDEEDCPVECVEEVFTPEQFAAALAAAGPSALVVVDFFKTACGACKFIYPGFVKLCRASAGGGGGAGAAPVMFLKHNVFDDEEEEVTALCKQYNVRSVPKFIFFKGGRELEAFSTRDKAKVAAAILKHAEPGSVEFGDWALAPAPTK